MVVVIKAVAHKLCRDDDIWRRGPMSSRCLLKVYAGMEQ